MATLPDTMKAFNGPVESPLQVAVPAWLTGEEQKVRSVENFETHMMQTDTRKVNMSAEDTAFNLLAFEHLRIVNVQCQ